MAPSLVPLWSWVLEPLALGDSRVTTLSPGPGILPILKI